MGFSIGEVSQAIGLAPQTLRLWERERLVRPRRTDRGYRVYTEPDVKRLRKIKHLRKVEGLNFAAIRKQLGATDEPRKDGSVKDEPPVAPGERLRRLRARAHKTLKEVSEATGLSISFISALERGGSGASVASLRRLAGAYGVTMREVFGADLDQISPLVRSFGQAGRRTRSVRGRREHVRGWPDPRPAPRDPATVRGDLRGVQRGNGEQRFEATIGGHGKC